MLNVQILLKVIKKHLGYDCHGIEIHKPHAMDSNDLPIFIRLLGHVQFFSPSEKILTYV